VQVGYDLCTDLFYSITMPSFVGLGLRMPPWEAKKFDVFCLLPVACAKRKSRYFGYSGAVCLSHFLTRFER